MKEFDLIVIGSGTGLQIASNAVKRGMDVAVVDDHSIGGTCLTRGCIPSKMLIHRADVAETVQESGKFGIEADIEGIRFQEIVEEVNDHVEEESENIVQGLRDSDRHTLYQERGKFVDEKVLEVGGEKITAPRILIAAGSRPIVPPIDGIEEVDYWTSRDALNPEEQPDHLVIIGGGYIAAELAHFYGTLETDITILEMSDTMLGNEDEEVREKFTEIFSEKYDVYTGYRASEVSEEDSTVKVEAESEGGETVEVSGDRLFVAAGREPNSDRLKVEEVGIETDENGFVKTDEHLETNVGGVYALGDIADNYMFKHSANHEAQYATVNMLTEHEHEADFTAMPHAVFSSPQVAGVGKTEGELKEEGIEYLVGKHDYADTAMGLALKEEAGFAKVLADHDSGEILGFHVIGPNASSIIHEVIVAMKSGSGTVDDIRRTVHIHPALNEVVQRTFSSLRHPEHLDHGHQH
ncbi:MAG: dihydrolipoyl dehydrogenase [Candidatus Nanohaloarchaeota archaeon QJJ-7]|nr:dihydrolipoyl dehydrogenase [Candidatus Nanohaloarchaeota archaeon QJJ-7]